jgi:hypothetical protein
VWPWSYDKCGEISHLQTKQLISACHDHFGHGMHPRQGRGAAEIGMLASSTATSLSIHIIQPLILFVSLR